MSGSVNTVILVGNVGKDPEIRHTNSGDKIANFSLATSESWKSQSGERKERTEWTRVVVWDQHLADIIEKYVTKGSKVFIRGTLQTRKWQAQDGTDKYTTEVVLQRYRGELQLLDKRDSGHDAAQQQPLNDQTQGSADLDDEITF